MARSTIATRRQRLFDSLLQLRSRSATAVAAGTGSVNETGIPFEPRQQLSYKAVLWNSSYIGTTDTYTLNIQVATSSATSATGTTIGSVTMPSAGGRREIYLGGATVETLVGTFAAQTNPLFVRASAARSGATTGTLSYEVFLTKEAAS